jgi:hypothetical protein
MKKTIIIPIILMLIQFNINAQHKRNILSFGLNYGFDKNINACRAEANIYGNNFHNDKIYNNASLDFGIYATKKFRTRLEFKYVEMGYSADWQNTDVVALKETVVNIYNLNLNMHFDFRIDSLKKFEFWVSPGVKWEYTMGDEFYNERYDGTFGYSNYNKIISEYPQNILCGSLSAIVKYNLTKHIGITLTPEYTIFFREFVKTNNKYYQRISCNLGLEFAF